MNSTNRDFNLDEIPDDGESGVSAPEPSPREPAFLVERVDEFYRERVDKQWRGGRITRGLVPGPDALVLTSNDYLSIGKHVSLINAQVSALEAGGHGLLQSGVFRNGEDELRKFERELARALGAEDAMACQSGWDANVGLIHGIAGPRTPVYIDLLAHASLWEGIVSAEAKRCPFRHNTRSR
jgi:CAI-1 autoinducer synthase